MKSLPSAAPPVKNKTLKREKFGTTEEVRILKENVIEQVNEYLPFLDEYGNRIKEEIRFALSLAEHKENDRWKNLVLDALDQMKTEIENGENPEKVVMNAEESLSEIGKVASR